MGNLSELTSCFVCRTLEQTLESQRKLEDTGVIVEDGPGGPRTVSASDDSGTGEGTPGGSKGPRFESIEGLDANPRFNPRQFSTG